MSTLVAIEYDDIFKAEEIRLKLLKMQKEYLIDLEDAVVTTKDKDGKIKLHQIHSTVKAGAVGGGLWGTLIGLLFLNPLLGMAVGAASGAVAGALSDVGINDSFMKELAENMIPNSSVLFVLVRKSTPDKVLDELKGTGGKILKTSLSHDDKPSYRQPWMPPNMKPNRMFPEPQMRGSYSPLRLLSSGFPPLPRPTSPPL